MEIIVYNNAVFNIPDADIDLYRNRGARILTAKERSESGMDGWENLVTPLTAYIAEDGKIHFSPPDPQQLLAGFRASKRAAINAGFDAAMSASLTMPSVDTPPSSFEVASALYDWRTEDPEGYAALLAIHTARRNELLAAVAAAETAAAVQAIVVSYAV